MVQETYQTKDLTNQISAIPPAAELQTTHTPFVCSTLPMNGLCTNGNPFERSLKRFLQTNLGEAEDK